MTQITNPDGKIWLALKGHMDDWTQTPIYYSPDVPQTPGTTSPYVIVTDLRLDADTRYVQGNAPDEYRGILNIAVMVPMDRTTAQAIGMAGRVADHWPKASWHEYDYVRVQVMKRPRVIGAAYVDHGMMRYQVQVEWRAVG